MAFRLVPHPALSPEYGGEGKDQPMAHPPTNYVMPAAVHNDLVAAAYRHRGYTADEADAAARFSELTARHGIKTHNAIKALHLDEHFGSKAGGCVPGATIEKLPPASTKPSPAGTPTASSGRPSRCEAMDECMRLADEFGVGVVAVDNAFHYLWGGGYVIDAARKGYIAYTCCTAALAEVVPFGGKFPTLGTNPHSWAFPTHGRRSASPSASTGPPASSPWAASSSSSARASSSRPAAASTRTATRPTDPNQGGRPASPSASTRGTACR